MDTLKYRVTEKGAKDVFDVISQARVADKSMSADEMDDIVVHNLDLMIRREMVR